MTVDGRSGPPPVRRTISDMSTLLPGRVLGALPSGPFRRSDALRRGIPTRALRELQRAGTLRQPLRGVLVPAACPDDVTVRARAAQLVLPEGAVACRGTAAWLLGVDARAPGDQDRPPDVECAVPRGVTPARRPGLRCYAVDLHPQDLTVLAGVTCTTATRTAVDLARWSTPGMGLAVLDRMARLGLVVREELVEQVERWRGDPFVARARRLVGLLDARAESFGESWLRLRLLDAGFPAPDLQISLRDDRGVERFRLDLGYVEHRWSCEYDGEAHHLGREAEAADRARRAVIERVWGWSVVGVHKNLVLGPSMALERAVGEVLGREPAIRRRLW